MGADVQATQGAGASAAMNFVMLSQNDSVPTCSALTFNVLNCMI